MEPSSLNSPKLQPVPDNNDPPIPGPSEKTKTQQDDKSTTVKPTSKGVENAKKRLRAFSIQKKSSLSSLPAKPLTSSGTGSTVFIGKFSSSKPPLKPGGIVEEVVDPKKPPKPPKPGTNRMLNADYLNLQKKTLSEIEDMKRKMELVELGIPLGLICPTPDSDKAMPTKAMPPIKSLLARKLRICHPLSKEVHKTLEKCSRIAAAANNPAKVDEIIQEAKLAKAEGRSFKFSYEKLLPSYNNPFQRKDKDAQPDERDRQRRADERHSRERRKSSEVRRYSSSHKRERDWQRDERDRRREVIRDREEKEDRKKEDKYKERKSKDGDAKSKERDNRSKDKDSKKDKMDTIHLSDDDDDVQEVIDEPEKKEADVDLKDFVVCDSWSENEDKKEKYKKETRDSQSKESDTTPTDPVEQLKQSLLKDAKEQSESLEKLKPVTDSFKFEIEDDDEEVLDMFDECTSIDKFAKIVPKKEAYSPTMRFDYESKDSTDGMDDTFLESVIAEIKQEAMDEESQDKGLVEYDSPKERESVTPELDERIRELYSSRSDYSDSFRSSESGCKSVESGYNTTESGHKSAERYKYTESGYTSPESDYAPRMSHKTTEDGYQSPELREEMKMPKSTVDSLETWSFVLKICQPLLFRHDKNKCYKETRTSPKVWFAGNPKLCACVKDRSVVYEELEMCKMELVHRVYGSHQTQEAIYPAARGWYPATFLAESDPVTMSSEWEAEDSQERPTPPRNAGDDIVLDREYQKFMKAVWPEVEGRSETPRGSPRGGGEGRRKRGKLSSEGWSQDSEGDGVDKSKRRKITKIKRKRKRSLSISASGEETPNKKKKKTPKKDGKNIKTKSTKRLSKKYLKKIKIKQLKKKKKLLKLDESEVDDYDKEKKKKDKKIKKKKPLKLKKKTQKKKKSKARSSSSDSESDKKSKKTKKKHKKRKQSSSESNQSEELFDVNILKNIKAERLSEDEKSFSPKKHREIINVKQLQNDFESIQIKKEVEDVNSPEAFEDDKCAGEVPEIAFEQKEEPEFKEPDYRTLTPQPKPLLEESNLSQSSSQESITSNKPYEKDDSHLRPSSQNSNYNFHDVMQSEGHELPCEDHKLPSEDHGLQSADHVLQNEDHGLSSEGHESHSQDHRLPSEDHRLPSVDHQLQSEGHELQSEGHELGHEEYEEGNYEMYEQLAMAYQSDVASQRAAPPDSLPSGRIETVVHSRCRGEIKCDWRAGEGGAAPAPLPRPSRWGAPAPAPPPAPSAHKVSRWGLKPSDVNIVLTGGSEPSEPSESSEPSEQFKIETVVAPAVYQIQSIANRTENSNTGYDEAYMDMYGASDRLQYGDCFSRESTIKPVESTVHTSSLDERIDLALRTTVLGNVAQNNTEKENETDKGILATKCVSESRSVKRVSFADGYKPGQDSDTEEPPARKKRKSRRHGCPWPCPATHPDHVSLWDALPPPPPPPGSPPPPARAPPPPLHLLRRPRAAALLPPRRDLTCDPSSMAAFMPPEPPPGLISF